MGRYKIRIFIFNIFFINFLEFASASLPIVLIKNCYDGDTCTTSKGEIVRLACIDTPELKGRNADFVRGLSAKNFLNNLIKNRKVSIKRITKDKYGRTVGELFMGNINIQELIVREGLGKIYRKYADQCIWSRNYKGF